MLSERLLSTVVRRSNERYLKLAPTDARTLPGPVPGRNHLLYVHVPFCTRLCPYCSFNRFPFSEGRALPYFESLKAELRMVANLGYDFESMYLGGGTPTVMIDELVEIIDLAKSLFSIREVSCETNPDHLVPEILEPLRDRVQRLSVGVQSFDDSLLRQMDRYDKYGSGQEILGRLQSVAGTFHSLNVDMIFNFPSQTPEMLAHDVAMLNESGCNQTTFYPLMASPVVRESLKQSVGAVSYEREYELYKVLDEGLSKSFEPASAWTFSRTGGGMIDEYIVDYEDYVGVGSGAFSFLDGSLWVNTFSLKEYSRRIGEGLMSAVAKRDFSTRERMRYRFMMGLFGLELDKAAFARDFGVTIERGLPVEMAFMTSVGAFDINNSQRATLTPKGRYLLVVMMREFFIGVNGVRDQARSSLPQEERDLIFGDGTAACAASDIKEHTDE
ncbi:MAG: coproporphyrinogen dehydrogenase [Actinobacteria bacterium HGW-Actinobacteria-10]|jgi:coproporphyrinogen III oxidase-like Fe-S oxidoreductase|nr:MAG: coproporphyrinogen dehydrogenase [Actinobacteria bacterium HGW-Actinobacteria-10]